MPLWSARSCSSALSCSRRARPGGMSTHSVPRVSSRSVTLTVSSASEAAGASAGQVATWSGPPGTGSRTDARLAPTALPAASATAESSRDGSGLSPSRRLKSASASYGAAEAPKASRSATRTTHLRSGWKAIATTAVASSENQNPPGPPSPSELPRPTTSAT